MKLGDVVHNMLKNIVDSMEITVLGIEHRVKSEKSLAERALANADLDILSSSVGLRFLCHAELLNKHYSLEKTTEFLKLSMGTAEKAQRQAKHLFRTYEKVKEECE